MSAQVENNCQGLTQFGNFLSYTANSALAEVGDSALMEFGLRIEGRC